MIRKRCHLLPLAVFAMAAFIAGCGGKGSTKLSYAPPFLPFHISFSMSHKGVWEVQAGAVTPLGTFAISQEFGRRDDFTYIVLRDRTKGTDQVFKIGVTGYVDIHAVGEHKIRLQQDDNRWIIETESLSGSLDFEICPSNSAVARIDLGESDPDIVIATNRTMIIEYPSIFSSPRTVPLDSLKSMTLATGWETRPILSFEWKEGVDHDRLNPIGICDRQNAEDNYEALQAAVSQVTDHLEFKRATNWAGSIGSAILFVFLIVVLLVVCSPVLIPLLFVLASIASAVCESLGNRS